MKSFYSMTNFNIVFKQSLQQDIFSPNKVIKIREFYFNEMSSGEWISFLQ